MASWHEAPLARCACGLVAALMAAGCADGGGRSGGKPESVAGEKLPAAAAGNSAPHDGPRAGTAPRAPGSTVSARELEAAVRADAARAWELPDGSTLELSLEAVIWADGSLGCPQPGRMYTQALVPGWRLVVRHGSRERLYHASRSGTWVQCPVGRAAKPLPGDAMR
jgi:hypothetical protein